MANQGLNLIMGNNSSLMVETKRLRLREMDDEDGPFFLLVLNEPAFVRNVGDRGVRSSAAAVDYLRERITPSYKKNGFGLWLVELKESGEPIGICGLIKRDALQDVDVGFSFLEQYWSRGFAFEAAAATLEYGWRVAKLPRIVAITTPQNVSSIRLLEKLGLRYEKRIQLPPETVEVMLFAIERPPESLVSHPRHQASPPNPSLQRKENGHGKVNPSAPADVPGGREQGNQK